MPQKKGANHSQQTLNNLKERLADAQDRLAALVELMKTGNVETLYVLGQPSMMRGIEWIEHFTDQAYRSFREHLAEAGAFEVNSKPAQNTLSFSAANSSERKGRARNKGEA
jgi:hypothetical protein